VKAHYRSKSGRLTFEVEGGNQKALFEGIADLQEVFEAEETCGYCDSNAIHFRVREVQSKKDGKKYKYYEMLCLDCSARFAFGQNQVGETLFPSRRDKEGNWLPNRGWYKWQPKDED
jgi:hypothetical protein